MVVLGGGAFSFERGTPVEGSLLHTRDSRILYTAFPTHHKRATMARDTSLRAISSAAFSLLQGDSLFINSQTRPLHANEGDETRRQGSNSP